MQLDSFFGPAELCPVVQRQVRVDRRRFEAYRVVLDWIPPQSHRHANVTVDVQTVEGVPEQVSRPTGIPIGQKRPRCSRDAPDTPASPHNPLSRPLDALRCVMRTEVVFLAVDAGPLRNEEQDWVLKRSYRAEFALD